MPNYLDDKFWEKEAKKGKGRTKKTRAKKEYTRYDPDTLEKVRTTRDDPDFDDLLTPTQMRAEKRRRAKEGDDDFGSRVGESILKEAKGEARKLWGSQRSRAKTAKEIKTIGTAIGSAASSAVPKVLKGIGLLGTVGGAVGAFATGAYYGNKNRKQAEEDYIKTQLGKYTWTNSKQFDLVKEHIRQQYRDQEANAAQRRYRIK